MKIIPYEPWHYEYLSGRTFTTLRIGAEAAKIYAMAYYLRGAAVSIKKGDKIVGCAGVFELWDGVGEAWSMFTDELRKCPFFLHRKAIKVLDDIITSRKYHRVQSIVLSTDPAARKWIERLGFTMECAMEKFGSDQSEHFMYKRIQ